jgi:hypothetical protein
LGYGVSYANSFVVTHELDVDERFDKVAELNAAAHGKISALSESGAGFLCVEQATMNVSAGYVKPDAINSHSTVVVHRGISLRS